MRVIRQAREMELYTIAGALLLNRKTIEIVLGPAINGIAIGTIIGSSSSSIVITLLFGKTIPRATKKRMIPPDIRNAGCSRLRKLRILSPPKAQIIRIAKAIMDSRRMIFCFCLSLYLTSMLLMMTRFPNGSMMITSISIVDASSTIHSFFQIQKPCLRICSSKDQQYIKLLPFQFRYTNTLEFIEIGNIPLAIVVN